MARNDDLTDKTQVSFSWTAPSNDGGEKILDYTVEMKQTQSTGNDNDFTEVAKNLTETSYT